MNGLRAIAHATVAVVALCGFPHAHATGRTDRPLDFARTFVQQKEPAGLHFQATYRDAHGNHRVEVWRDGQQALHRQTDNVLDLFVRCQDAHDPGFDMTVLDQRRRIRTDISRTSLGQIGHHADWFSLAHGLAIPSGPYRLVAMATPPISRTFTKPPAHCDWYRLAASGHDSMLCWSRRHGLPLLIVDALTGEARWTVTAVEAAVPKPSRFHIQDEGYAHVDANRDVQAD